MSVEHLLKAGRTAIVAGNGQLPMDVASRLQKKGYNPFIFAIEGEADNALRSYDHVDLPIARIGLVLSLAKKNRIANFILAGGVRVRPRIHELRFDWAAVRAFPKVAFALASGDNQLLSVLVRVIEGAGFKVIGPHQILTEMAAPLGSLTKAGPARQARKDMEKAVLAARTIGELDIGQGAVSVGGRVVALEGAEGTDQMLERVAEIKAQGRVRHSGGVLAKVLKPDQEVRVDMPTIGPKTVERACDAGLDGIVVQAGSTLILECAHTVTLADEAGLFIYGVEGA